MNWLIKNIIKKWFVVANYLKDRIKVQIGVSVNYC